MIMSNDVRNTMVGRIVWWLFVQHTQQNVT